MKCVHLDFHTGPDIEGIGEYFNKEEFANTLKEAKVDLITVFAKCHHGLSYYPTKVGTMHPHLKFDLLKEQIDACHSVGVKAPVYITMGWSKKDADYHPEWHHIDFWKKQPIYYGSKPSDNLDEEIYDCSWTTLCPVGSYKDYLIEITREVCENYDVSDGVFYDICFIHDACSCEACVKGMKEMGLNPDNYEDARTYYRIKRIELMKDLTGVVHEYSKDANVFYNGGADMNRPEYHPYQTHYELEDLPTAWGGYDLMPLRAKYFERYGKTFLGMTGKFHHSWGEFGGFKNKDALKYELADMVSIGASMSVGDHLHPCGKLDKSTYAIMGHAFSYIDKIEKYSENTKAYTDIAIWMSHREGSDMGCSKILQIMHLDFDVIEDGENLDKYQCVILPDYVNLAVEDKANLVKFTNKGGKIVASYKSGFKDIGIEMLGESEYNLDYIKCDIDEITTPFLAYSHAYRVNAKGEVLAQVYEPYFNRTWRHFCGHKNTPNRLEGASYPALVKSENVLYFAHPIFEAYNKSGNYVLQKYIMNAINGFYDKIMNIDNFFSCGRARIREGKNFYALHLLYAPPVNRGNVCILEDFPRIDGIEVSIKIPNKVKSVKIEPEGKNIEFVQNNGVLSFKVDDLRIHKLIVISY